MLFVCCFHEMRKNVRILPAKNLEELSSAQRQHQLILSVFDTFSLDNTKRTRTPASTAKYYSNTNNVEALFPNYQQRNGKTNNSLVKSRKKIMGMGIIDFSTSCPWELYLFAFCHLLPGVCMYLLDACALLTSKSCTDTELIWERLVAVSLVYVGVFVSQCCLLFCFMPDI